MSNTMREILFRGKRVDNGEWVKGDPAGSICGTISKIEFYDGLTDCETVDVIPETVGQFTGLTDKNGTKIFEGDIVTYDKEYGGKTREKGTVYWCDGAFWVENVQNKEGYGLLGALVNYQLEIIGNIHDNPELLEVNNELQNK